MPNPFSPLCVSCLLSQSCPLQAAPWTSRGKPQDIVPQGWRAAREMFYISQWLVYLYVKCTNHSLSDMNRLALWLLWPHRFNMSEKRQIRLSGLGKGIVCRVSPQGDRWIYVHPCTKCMQTSKSNWISSLSNKTEHNVFFKQSVLSTGAQIFLISQTPLAWPFSVIR